MTNVKKRNDIILISFLIIASILLLFALSASRSNEEADKVAITIDGEVYQTLSLSKNTSIKVLQDNKFNIVEVKDGKVSITDANCPDKVCVEHKPIEYNGEQVVCLPHKVVVEVKGNKQDDVDSIAK